MTSQKPDNALAVVETTTVEVLQPAAVQAITSAEIDRQIATAKQFPRSVQGSLNEAIALATLDEDTARSMFYVLPRDGKKIEGPSVRLAEVMSHAWGNLRVSARIVEEGREFLTAQGICHDLEKNVAVSTEVQRRILTKQGKRYGSDMIATTGNAACSIALRNAVFRVIPRAFVDRILAKAKEVSVSGKGTLEQKRAAAIRYFESKGAKAKSVFETLGVRGVEDLTIDHLIDLGGMRTALEEGTATIAELFGPKEEPTPEPAKPSALDSLLGDGD